MPDPSPSAPVLVIGGTGKTGRRVADRLRQRGVPVRVGGRGQRPPFDWDDATTWGPALDGARAAYVAYVPDLAVPGAPEAIETLAATALDRGVRRLVLLSGRGEPEAEDAERILAASGAEWTVVRCSWFMQNFTEGFLVDGIRAGELAFPADAVREPFVDVEDIADVAVAALTEDRHVGHLYELTGPRALTFAEAVAEIAAATGRTVRYEPITVDAFAAGMRAEGLPADLVDLLTYLTTTVLDGRGEPTTDGVERALGRPPRDFSAFAREAAASGVWDRVPAGA